MMGLLKDRKRQKGEKKGTNVVSQGDWGLMNPDSTSGPAPHIEIISHSWSGSHICTGSAEDACSPVRFVFYKRTTDRVPRILDYEKEEFHVREKRDNLFLLHCFIIVVVAEARSV